MPDLTTKLDALADIAEIVRVDDPVVVRLDAYRALIGVARAAQEIGASAIEFEALPPGLDWHAVQVVPDDWDRLHAALTHLSEVLE